MIAEDTKEALMAVATRTITQTPDQFVTVEGLKTHYLATGSGHPLVIMHGGAPGGAARVIYGACIEPLAEQGLAVYAPDAPGFGLTDTPDDNSVRFRIEHAKAFATAMGLDRYHVMGNSMGVLPSLRLALEDPRVARVVLVAGTGVDVQLSPEAREIAREHSVVLNSYTPGLENMRELTMGTLHRKELVSEELIQLRYEMSEGQNAAAREGRSQAATAVPMPPITPEELRASYTKPTLLLWGKDDHGNPIERGYRTLEAIPGAEFHVFADCGHWPMWDQTERFVSVVGGFLSG
jgi:pimeloyl-ACP methyl ester carboxylesterase